MGGPHPAGVIHRDLKPENLEVLALGVGLHSDPQVPVRGENGVLQAVKASTSGGRHDRVRGVSLAVPSLLP